MIAPGTSRSTPVTQAAILLEPQAPSPADDYLYSVSARQSRPETAPTPRTVRERWAPTELLRFFTERSRAGDRLVVAPREHLRETAHVSVHEGTPIPARFERHLSLKRETRGASSLALDPQTPGRVDLEISVEPTTRPLDPFFFKSLFRLRTDDDVID